MQISGSMRIGFCKGRDWQEGEIIKGHGKIVRMIDMFIILMWLGGVDGVMGVYICQNLSNYTF